MFVGTAAGAASIEIVYMKLERPCWVGLLLLVLLATIKFLPV